jgi:lysophospholipase L1-like esterase
MKFRTYPPASPDRDFIVPLEVRADHRILLAAFVVLALAVPTLPAAAADPEILVVGDSWALQIYEDGALTAALNAAGRTEIGVLGDQTAISGSTASEWAQASMLQILTDELAANPEVEVVVVFVGGNDFLEGMSGGGWYVGMDPAAEAALFANIESDVAAVVDHILGLDSDIEVVLSSYDYPNFVETLNGLLGLICRPLWEDLGEPTPAQINATALLLHDRYDALAATRPRVVSVAHWGLMQWLYGYPSLGIGPGELALPGDASLPSPPQAMRTLGADCFHLKPDGYDGIATRLWQEALEWSFDGVFASGFESGNTDGWSATIPDR